MLNARVGLRGHGNIHAAPNCRLGPDYVVAYYRFDVHLIIKISFSGV